MSDAAPYSVRDGIAVITLNNPPVNGLGSDLRAAIIDGLRKAVRGSRRSRPSSSPASAKAFSGGADIREFNTPKSACRPIAAP